MKTSAILIALSAHSLVATAALSAQAQSMAVIKGRNGCPSGSSEYYIHVDNEDTNNVNDRSGWLGDITSDRNTTIRLCSVNDYAFSPAAEPYMLVSLAPSYCAAIGAETVLRSIDCENRRPACASDIPGVITSSASRDMAITFCLFSGGSGFTFPNYGVEYGVFAPPAFSGAIEHGYIYMDDQQASIFGDNHNGWCDNIDGPFSCSGLSDDRNYHDIIYGGHNTAFNIARVR